MKQLDWWPAPAKLNLFLHILGQRSDGYHLLQTVFQFIDFGDALAFEVRQDGCIRRGREVANIPEQQDLALRAARLLQQYCAVKCGVNIYLDKRLPLGAGLGGGSSDAATVLIALNHLWRTGLSTSQLASLGLQLGADVPVFVHGHAAWAEGIGEQLQPVDLPEPWYLVVLPGCHVETATVFTDPGLTRNCHPITIEGFISGQGGNVCEEVACRHYPDIAEALAWLTTQAEGHNVARMSGTGSSVFLSFDTESQARRACEKVPLPWRGIVTRGMNHSPLQQKLAGLS